MHITMSTFKPGITETLHGLLVRMIDCRYCFTMRSHFIMLSILYCVIIMVSILYTLYNCDYLNVHGHPQKFLQEGKLKKVIRRNRLLTWIKRHKEEKGTTYFFFIEGGGECLLFPFSHLWAPLTMSDSLIILVSHSAVMTMTRKISLFDINHLNTMIRENKAEKINVVNDQEIIQNNIECPYCRPTP